MKIEFLPVWNYRNQNNNDKPLQQKAVEYNNITQLSNVYYVPFGCSETSKQSFGKQLEELKDVHCPSCGVKMLTREEFGKLLNEAAKLKTPKEFVDFINPYRESIIPQIRFLLNFAEKITNDNPDIDFDNMLRIIKSSANKNIIRTVGVISAQVGELSQDDTFSQSDKQRLLECKNKLDELKNTNYKQISLEAHKNIFADTIMNMEDSRNKQLYIKTKNLLAESIFSRIVWGIKPDEINSGSSIPFILTRNILAGSVSKSYTMNRYNVETQEPLDSNYNKILLCKRCEKNPFAISSVLNADEVKKEHYYKYIDDVAQKVIEDKIDDIYYPVKLNGLMRKLSRMNLDRRVSESLLKLKKKYFSMQDPREFDLTSVKGIPCANCGQDTITHDEKVLLHAKIADVKDKSEYIRIIEENKGIIRKPYLPIAERLEDLIKSDPQMSDEEILNQLRIFAKEAVNKKFKNNIHYMYKVLDSKIYQHEDIKKIEEYIDAVKQDYLNSSDDNLFIFEDYNKLIRNTIGQMNCYDKYKYIEKLKYSIKDLHTASNVLYPAQTALDKYDSALKVVLQDIFKASVATKDHFVAKKNSGADDEKNYVVLCRNCNASKSSSGVHNWLNRNPQFQENMQKQVNFITEKIKSGELDKSKINYIKDLQSNIYSLTDGKIEINFNEDDFMI